ncbi:MAG TPA: hypothetical protein VHI75_07065 [Casimicrobiaceae bacterium]|nr:hypothetical protein [Casimicrobiaceae bacterium]
MKRTPMVFAAMLTAAPCAVAWACGACDEDKIAATYDHAVIERATARHHQVVFVAIDGPVSAAEISRRVAAAAPNVRGVVAGTLRTALSPPAFSFALDGTQKLGIAMADFRKAIRDRDARLTLVRVMRDGALVEPN